jgi:hypothetical protein
MLALPVVFAGVAAGAAASAPAAFAVTDTSGTASITVPQSYIHQLDEAGVTGHVVSPASTSVDTTNNTTTASFPVTGGNADVSIFYGTLNLGGKVSLEDRHGTVTLNSLQFDLSSGTITATPDGSSTPVTLLDIAGQVTTSQSGTSQNYRSTQLKIDPAGAAYLDSALATNAFVAGQNVGSFAASWTAA